MMKKPEPELYLHGQLIFFYSVFQIIRQRLFLLISFQSTLYPTTLISCPYLSLFQHFDIQGKKIEHSILLRIHKY